MLHITNGDAVGDTLRRSGVPGEVSISADVLHEGPCPAGLTPTDWRETRARYLADRGYVGYDAALERLIEWDAALHAARSHDEVVLWFEHDLYDQLILLRLLSWFATHGAGRARLSLICIGSYPGFSHFHGLGQLDAAQLAALLPGRAPITGRQLRLGDDAWRRFGSSEPQAFAALLGADTRVLPFLNAAVRRALEEYPSTLNGLSRSEHQAVAAIAAGASDLSAAFRAAQEMEHDLFMGDASFVALVHSLAEATRPLVAIEPRGGRVPPGRQQVTLTALGREVLAGRADYARVNGIDRWVGGVHLRGRTPPWRWDETRGLVEPSSP